MKAPGGRRAETPPPATHDTTEQYRYDDVAVVRWPSGEDERRRLAAAGLPRLLLVAGDHAPPDEWAGLEDWLREPGPGRAVHAPRALAPADGGPGPGRARRRRPAAPRRPVGGAVTPRADPDAAAGGPPGGGGVAQGAGRRHRRRGAARRQPRRALVRAGPAHPPRPAGPAGATTCGAPGSSSRPTTCRPDGRRRADPGGVSPLRAASSRSQRTIRNARTSTVKAIATMIALPNDDSMKTAATTAAIITTARMAEADPDLLRVGFLVGHRREFGIPPRGANTAICQISVRYPRTTDSIWTRNGWTIALRRS